MCTFDDLQHIKDLIERIELDNRHDLTAELTYLIYVHLSAKEINRLIIWCEHKEYNQCAAYIEKIKPNDLIDIALISLIAILSLFLIIYVSI